MNVFILKIDTRVNLIKLLNDLRSFLATSHQWDQSPSSILLFVGVLDYVDGHRRSGYDTLFIH